MAETSRKQRREADQCRLELAGATLERVASDVVEMAGWP